MRKIATAAAAMFFAVCADLGAQGKGQLDAVATWAAGNKEENYIDGKAAKALALNQDGGAAKTTAVITNYLDHYRSVNVFRAGDKEFVILTTWKGSDKTYYLTDRSGNLIRAVDWRATSANPTPMASAAATPAFNELKKFWIDQLGKPAR